MEINNIRLLVDDFKSSYNFYKNTLGLEVSYGTVEGPYASFEVSELSQLAIFNSDMMAETIDASDLPKPEKVRDKFVIVIEVDNVDETYKILKRKNVKFINEPMDMDAWGIRVAHFRDPENNLIELFSEIIVDVDQ